MIDDHLQDYLNMLRVEVNASPNTIEAYESDVRRYLIYINETEGFDQVWSSPPIFENMNHDYSPRTVGVGDLDGDGREEIVFRVSATGQEGWYIFEWNGVVGSDDYGDTYSSINSVELDICCIDDASSVSYTHLTLPTSDLV